MRELERWLRSSDDDLTGHTYDGMGRYVWEKPPLKQPPSPGALRRMSSMKAREQQMQITLAEEARAKAERAKARALEKVEEAITQAAIRGAEVRAGRPPTRPPTAGRGLSSSSSSSPIRVRESPSYAFAGSEGGGAGGSGVGSYDIGSVGGESVGGFFCPSAINRPTTAGAASACASGSLLALPPPALPLASHVASSPALLVPPTEAGRGGGGGEVGVVATATAAPHAMKGGESVGRHRRHTVEGSLGPSKVRRHTVECLVRPASSSPHPKLTLSFDQQYWLSASSTSSIHSAAMGAARPTTAGGVRTATSWLTASAIHLAHPPRPPVMSVPRTGSHVLLNPYARSRSAGKLRTLSLASANDGRE